jgi:hypothetical protein
MSFTRDFKPDYEYGGGGGLQPREYTAAITGAVETVSKAGNNMIKVTLNIQGAAFTWCIVEGDFFNKKLTKFCVCFGIKPGNFNYGQWRGCAGRVFIDKDPQNTRYLKIAYLVTPEDAGNNAPSGALENYKKFTPEDYKKFTDDIPF